LEGVIEVSNLDNPSSISRRLAVGDLAPNMQLMRTTGECVTLAELFKHKRTVLVFLRHFG
jgi:peroxiredoxin